MFESWADRIYVSYIFEWNKDKAALWASHPRALVGGTGYDYKVKLPREIEGIVPKINIGFTTRGCIRRCGFCFVPKMEGSIRAVADINQIWDGKAKEIMLLDNNILALPSHFKLVCDQIRKNKLKVDFNQGLDLRLLYANKGLLLEELQTIKHPEYKFAWDLDDDSMVDKLKWLNDVLGRCTIYVYTGDISYEKAYWKVNELKKMNHNAHLMLHISQREGPKDAKLRKLRSWVNAHAVFQGMTFEEYLESDGKIDSKKSTIDRKSHKEEVIDESQIKLF
jgi:hypothetical protein